MQQYTHTKVHTETQCVWCIWCCDRYNAIFASSPKSEACVTELEQSHVPYILFTRHSGSDLLPKVYDWSTYCNYNQYNVLVV